MTVKKASRQQQLFAIAGFGVKLKFTFSNVVRSRGTILQPAYARRCGRAGRSALTFRCAPFLKPPMPATANSQTLAAMFL